MEPWGTPGAGGQKDEEGPVKETEMEESVKQDENQWSAKFWKPGAEVFQGGTHKRGCLCQR